MITVQVREMDKLCADGIENFSIMLDDDTKSIVVYHKDERLGTLANMWGLTEDEFIKQIKLKDSKPIAQPETVS